MFKNKILYSIIFILLINRGFAAKIDFILPADKKVNKIVLAGDFNNWAIDQYLLARVNDTLWHITLDFAPGIYHYRFLIDDKQWIKDPGNIFYDGPRSNSILFVQKPGTPKVLSIFPKNGDIISTNIKSVRINVSSDRGWDLKRSSLKVNDKTYSLAVQSDSIILARIVNFVTGDNYFYLDLIPMNGSVYPQISGLWTKIEKPFEHYVDAGFTAIVTKGEPFSLNGGLSYSQSNLALTNIRWKWDANYLQLISAENSLFPHFLAKNRGISKVYLKIDDLVDSTLVYIGSAKKNNLHYTIHQSLIPDKFGEINSVHLAGDFNHWSIKAEWQLHKKNDEWSLERVMEAGKYEYKLVLNKKDWLEDPQSVDRVEDGWNGYNSVMTVEPHAFCQVNNIDLSLVDGILNFSDRTSLFGDALPGYFYFEQIVTSPLVFGNKLNDFELFHAAKQCEDEVVSTSFIIDHKKLKPLNATPQWADSAIIYEIFIRNFSDDGHGTFHDVVRKIPYLKQLGVNTIWFMPVYEGPTEHGYAPSDFFKTESDYGNLEAFKSMIRQLKKAGFHVIFDFVANHMSDQHPFFRASANAHSVYHDWFYWSDNGKYRYNADWDVLPDLNWSNPQVRNYMLKVAYFWQATGIDGFRCDAAWGVPHDFWKDFRIYLKSRNPEFLLIDEVLPRDPSFHREEFDASYDTDFYGNVLDLFNQKKRLSGLIFGLQKTRFNYPAGTLDLRYIENHDMPRFITRFGPEKAVLASVLLLLSPGMPLIYYGQETGLKETREPMQWDLADEEQNKLYRHYKRMINVRKYLKINASSTNIKFSSPSDELLRIEGNGFIAWLNFSNSKNAIINTASKSIKYSKKLEVSSGEAIIAPLGFVIAQ